jgi:energy-dependent translational throttle protein EttA
LSGGEKRRVAICALLLSNPDVLLLDEPTNHLDAESVAWLEAYLKRFEGTLVVVTHDRYFLQNVTEWILEMEGARAIPYQGQLRELAGAETGRHRTHGQGPGLPAEAAGAGVDVGAYERGGEALPQSGPHQALRGIGGADRGHARRVHDHPDPDQRPARRLGSPRGNLTKVYDERILMEGVDFNLPRGGIVGVIGPNGAGKTTLVRMIVGQEEPTSGTLTVGPTVQIAYVDQSRDSLQ